MSDKCILIVDDEEAIRFSLKLFLEDFGWQVFEAADPDEALEQLKRQEIPLALIDIRLAGKSGNRLIVDALGLQPRLKVLIHTGSIDYSVPEELRQLGLSDDCIVRKPQPDLMAFEKRLAQALES